MYAYCFANGVIKFGQWVPKGAIKMAKGKAGPLRTVITATARLAYDSSTLLVPGVPEAPNQDEGLMALSKHLAWLSKRPITGVEFAEINL